jgi:hypothetical protein
MVSQFAALERRTFSTGRERVDPKNKETMMECDRYALSLVVLAVHLPLSYRRSYPIRRGWDEGLSWLGRAECERISVAGLRATRPPQ